jgi:hypothetical protein
VKGEEAETSQRREHAAHDEQQQALDAEEREVVDLVNDKEIDGDREKGG